MEVPLEDDVLVWERPGLTGEGTAAEVPTDVIVATAAAKADGVAVRSLPLLLLLLLLES